jgi:molybdopterin-binding protein
LPSIKQVDYGQLQPTGDRPQPPRTVDYSPARAGWPRNTLFEDFVMKISARNQLKGKIVDVKKGATTSHVRLEIAPGQVVTASITNESVDELGLKAGQNAVAIIKATSVMIAVD